MRRRPVLSTAAGLAVLVVLPGGCASTGRPPPTQAYSAAQLEVTPHQAEVKAGSLRLSLDNRDPVEHVMSLRQGGGELTVAPRSLRTVTVRLAPGTYTWYCSVPGHTQMVTTIVAT